MCEPYTMAALMVVSAGVTIYGQQEAAKAQEQSANYNARVADNNAKVAESNVRVEQQRSAAEENRQRIKTAAMIGAQRASFGASGIDINSGTAVDVQASTASMGFEDLLNIRTNSIARQNQFHQQATDFTNQASLLRTGGANARRMANIQGMGTALSTATSIGSMGMNAGWFDGGGATGGGTSFYGSSFDQPSLGNNGIY